MSILVLFPVGSEAQADTYLAFVNDPANVPWEPPTYTERVDIHGQRVVCYVGPGGMIWNGEPVQEPEGGEAARAGGVLVDGAGVEWPED